MDNFSIGPFTFEAGAAKTINGTQQRSWALRYGHNVIAKQFLPAVDRSAVREAFSYPIGAFVRAAQAGHGPRPVQLQDQAGNVLASFLADGGTVPGMTAGLTDDRSPFWLVTASTPTRSMPVTLTEFAELATRYSAPARAWVAGLLPESVLTTDPEAWEPPSAWQIRHIVGEGSFTGVTGAAAAELIGVTPQNFRKYTAADGASTRQRMSYAMWHLLLHRLGVQRML